MVDAKRPVILITDDDTEDRIRMRRYLQSDGYEVLEAVNGEDALALVGDSAIRIDLLITDVRMPHLDGSELAKRVRGNRPDLKVLFVSGYSLEILALLKSSIDKSMLINKSVDKSEFLSKVKRFIGIPVPGASA